MDFSPKKKQAAIGVPPSKAPFLVIRSWMLAKKDQRNWPVSAPEAETAESPWVFQESNVVPVCPSNLLVKSDLRDMLVLSINFGSFPARRQHVGQSLDYTRSDAKIHDHQRVQTENWATQRAFWMANIFPWCFKFLDRSNLLLYPNHFSRLISRPIEILMNRNFGLAN